MPYPSPEDVRRARATAMLAGLVAVAGLAALGSLAYLLLTIATI